MTLDVPDGSEPQRTTGHCLAGSSPGRGLGYLSSALPVAATMASRLVGARQLTLGATSCLKTRPKADSGDLLSCGALFSSIFFPPLAITRVALVQVDGRGQPANILLRGPTVAFTMDRMLGQIRPRLSLCVVFSFFLASIGSRLAGWLLHNP